ncbi:DUF952 domain-containing protein [Nocardioides fonticola]|uniref:DUF952 domain-containing protein n=1 Tax=Nocardioides fonticola TaxID=450363 RepID=A0ABP7XDQ8_9ACTN
MIIHHLALRTDWDAALAIGEYRVSTRGLTLEQVGFLHASTPAQWPVVRERFYADLDDAELVLLDIDVGVLTARGIEVVEEPGEPGGSELFPHIRGALPCDAVVATRRLSDRA